MRRLGSLGVPASAADRESSLAIPPTRLAAPDNVADGTLSYPSSKAQAPPQRQRQLAPSTLAMHSPDEQVTPLPHPPAVMSRSTWSGAGVAPWLQPLQSSAPYQVQPAVGAALEEPSVGRMFRVAAPQGVTEEELDRGHSPPAGMSPRSTGARGHMAPRSAWTGDETAPWLPTRASLAAAADGRGAAPALAVLGRGPGTAGSTPAVTQQGGQPAPCATASPFAQADTRSGTETSPQPNACKAGLLVLSKSRSQQLEAGAPRLTRLTSGHANCSRVFQGHAGQSRAGLDSGRLLPRLSSNRQQ